MAGKDSGKDLTDLPGVGAATAKKLKDAGLTTVAKIRKAGRDGLTAAGISTPTAARILKGGTGGRHQGQGGRQEGHKEGLSHRGKDRQEGHKTAPRPR